MLGGERGMRSARVLAYANDLGAGIGEVLVGVAEATGLRRAPGRVILGIEIEDDRLLSPIARQPDRASGPVRELKIRGALTQSRHSAGTHLDPPAPRMPEEQG